MFGTALKTGTETLPNGYFKSHATSRLLSKEVCRIAAANSVPGLCELFESWKASHIAHQKIHNFLHFFILFHSVATFLWVSLCDNKFELCGANLQTLWLFHRLFAMLCLIQFSIRIHSSHSYRLKSHINSQHKEAIQFVCVLPKHVTLGAFKTKNVSRTTPPPTPPASRLRLGINYKQSWLHSDERK